MANNPSKGIKPEDKNKGKVGKQAQQPQSQPKKETEAPVIEAEVVDTAAERGLESNITPSESKLARIGRLSPDGMVNFAGQLKAMYIDTDAPSASAAAAVISIQHRYLTHIALTQIGEDAGVLGMSIEPSELLAVQQAASVLKIDIQSALPASEDPSQLQIKFDPNTVPTAVKEQIEKEEKSGATEVDLDPTKVYKAEELKERLLHLLNRGNSRSSNVPEAINWYANNLTVTATKAAEEFLKNNQLSEDSAKDNTIYQDLLKAAEIAKNTKKVDIFNQVLDILGSDTPSIVNGICASVWRRYIDGATVMPAHFYVKSFAKNWSDEDIRDFVTLIVNLEASKVENKERFQKVTYLHNPSQEYVDSIVDAAIKSFESNGETRTAEANILRNNMFKFVVQKRVPIRERFGSAIQSVINLYVDQANQTARLAKYKDLSEYSNDTPSADEGEKKN